MLVLVGIALFCLSIALYAPSIAFGFIGYDDIQIVIEHPNLYAKASLWDSLREIFVGYFPREEPLLVRDVTWALDAHIFGFTNPMGYHLGNVVLNAVDVVLVFALLLHATRSAVLAALAATLFAGLAVHVEPVCWVMGRKDLLSACFVLLALLAQSFQLRQENQRLRCLLAGAVFLLYPLAVLSKFSAIVVVLVLAAQRVFALYLDGRRQPGQPLMLAEWPRLLAGLIPHTLVGLGLHFWYQRTLTAFTVIGTNGPPFLSLIHLKNLGVLIPLSLEASLVRIFRVAEHSAYYLRPSVELYASRGELALAFATVAGLAVLITALVRFRKDVAFFPIVFLLFLLPYFNVEYVGIWAADRYSYLASFGVVALVAAPVALALRSSNRNLGRAAVAGMVLMALFLGHQIVGGREHQAAFRDGDSFWSYEKSLPRPSMLAFSGYLIRMMSKAAEAEPGSVLRRQLLDASVAAAKDGVRYYASVPWKPAPLYASRERFEFAKLYTALGTASELSGGLLEQQIEFFRTAVLLSPSDNNTRDLARSLLALAMREPRNIEVARESLLHYRDHVRMTRHDPIKIARLRAELQIYAGNFTELAAEVKAIETEDLR